MSLSPSSSLPVRLLRQVPNAITVGRVLLVVPTAWYLWQEAYPTALALMAIAGASDAVDGWVARTFHWQSRFGEVVDPMADKLLIGTVFVLLTLQGHVPVWLLLVILGRDLIILAGALVYRGLFGDIEMAPTFVSKSNTAFQILLVLLVLVSHCGFPWLSPLSHTLVYPFGIVLVALLGIVSGLDYVLIWGRKAWRQAHQIH